MLKQSQQQKLLQKLSPQQIQLMKLLQVPTASLEERIKEEIEENPALEYSSDSEYEQDEYGLSDKNDGDDTDTDDADLSDDTADKVDLDEFLRHEDDDGGSDYGYDYNGGESERQTIPVRVETSFHDHLLDQLGLLELDERSQKIAEQIIGSLDEDGYLRREVTALVDDLAFGQNVYTSVEEVNELIGKIQQFDPPGICAWTLQECLLLQLRRIEPQTKEVKNAIEVIDRYFNEFIKKHYDKIQRHLGLNDADFKEVINCIIRLNPKPGSAFAVLNKAESYIIPDFFVFNNNGILELTLNAKNAPELRVSEGYKEMMKAYDRSEKKDKRQKEALMFIKQKLDAAKWFIDAIKQRQHTLLHTMHAILTFQHEFFLTGDDTTLKPMILKDIAQATSLDVSTVSRVANSKFVQTEFGTYKLKYFFSEALQTESGEEVSTREVKSILTDIIGSEDKRKPHSDEKLTDMLQEKGYNIARRTVAKYREQLNIPVARLRKEL
ncbi:RNA polymerase factor sigma-54 [Chitinophagaceae bacterium MMS25-I14]